MDYADDMYQTTYQKERWTIRKLQAIEYKGGKCIKCGYNKCHGALDFHHRDPKTKKYVWRKLRLHTWSTIIEELDKCDLLCANCHREIHTKEIKYVLNHNRILGIKQPPVMKICKHCGNDYEIKSNSQKYCSNKCSKLALRKIKRPPLDVLLKEIEETNYCAVGRKYGVSDNAIRKWIKNAGH